MRYVLHPGFVKEAQSGRWWYASAQDLMLLYQVNHCVVYDLSYTWKPDDIHLYPRSDGNYSLEASCLV